VAEETIHGNGEVNVSVKIYACGFAMSNLQVDQTCPHDIDLPHFDEFEIELSEETPGN
jgi:hypothetical protein